MAKNKVKRMSKLDFYYLLTAIEGNENMEHTAIFLTRKD